MTINNDITKVLYDVIDKLNRQLPPDRQLDKNNNTILTGENGSLDSLGLINFIVVLEQGIEDTFRKTITLTDEQLLADTNGPFHTLGSLTEYLAEKLRD